jgi:formylmethanofuran dehydrogenase subunit E
MDKSPASIAFVGRSGSGKTTLLERVLQELKSRGVRTAMVKHTHHLIDWDTAGKDSWRFREASAGPVVLETPERLMLQATRQGAPRYHELLPDVELILHEGDRASMVDKVIVGESADEASTRGTAGRIVAVVAGPPIAGLPHFELDDIDAVVSFLLSRLDARPCAGRASFDDLLEKSVAAHGHLCPGQVLGVRMSIRGLEELGLEAPPPKRLIAVVETDRCAADAVASVTGCSLGKRTLKHYDYGKMAASFLDLQTGDGVRVVAREDSRERAHFYAPGITDPHRAQTEAYREMPDAEIMTVQRVRILLAPDDLPGSPRARAQCERCGEHVSDGREVLRAGSVFCKACAGRAYYAPVGAERLEPSPWR